LDSTVQKDELMMPSLVIMGVAGCGKSTLGEALAQRLGWPLIEGDAHHSAANIQKMQTGTALTDADREGWLAALAQVLREQPSVVLTCSALKASYRDRLRAACPGLGFVFLRISPTDAQARVAQRAGAHFFSASLVSSQFATLQDPSSEPRVLATDALLPVIESASAAAAWWAALNAEVAA
jgi:gluconokinase